MTRDELTPGRKVWVCDPAEGILPQPAVVRSRGDGDRAAVLTKFGEVSVEHRYCYPARVDVVIAFAGLCRSMADYYCGLAAFYRRALDILRDPQKDETADPPLVARIAGPSVSDLADLEVLPLSVIDDPEASDIGRTANVGTDARTLNVRG